jgi:hypothetical protein
VEFEAMSRHENALLFRRWSGIWEPCRHAFDWC